MPRVRKCTNWFRKVSSVSTFATPAGQRLAVSTVFGGTSPYIQLDAHDWSITTVDGVSPVSTVACQQAASNVSAIGENARRDI